MDAATEALAAAHDAGVEVRPLQGLEDANRALEVMRLTWGDGEGFPPQFLRAMEAAGHLVLGALANDRLEGFTLGFYGDRDGMHFHSHMLAVRPEAQRRGVGFALKQAQRSACLAAEVSVMRWTFDPLQVRNAIFNLEKLGAVADGFERNFYGTMDDAQSYGDRGDRLWARWDLDRPERVDASAVAGHVVVPPDYWDLRMRDHVAAQRMRDAVADALEEGFGEGRTIVGFRNGGYVFA